MIPTRQYPEAVGPGQATRRPRVAVRTGPVLLVLALWVTSAAAAAAGSATDHGTLVALASSDVTAREDAAIRLTSPRDRAVLGAIEQWRSSWERGDTGAYLAAYVEGVSPIRSMEPGEWRQRRAHQLSNTRNLRIGLSDLDIVALETDVAEVRFRQSYQAENFRDRLWKVLKLMRTPDGWRIRHEEVLLVRPEG